VVVVCHSWRQPAWPENIVTVSVNICDKWNDNKSFEITSWKVLTRWLSHIQQTDTQAGVSALRG
jgi:hypothetical protein